MPHKIGAYVRNDQALVQKIEGSCCANSCRKFTFCAVSKFSVRVRILILGQLFRRISLIEKICHTRRF